jgi:hypothetical protein
VVCGERHLRHLVREFAVHAERPHQGPGNVLIPDAEADAAGEPPIIPFPCGPVRCRSRLGGLLRHDHRAAAWPRSG